jgi:hypothetical protein
VTTSTPSPDSLEWLPATTDQHLLSIVAVGGGLAGVVGLLATGLPLRYCVIGVLLGGGTFAVFMALIARRSLRRMTTKASTLDAPLAGARRASMRSFLVGRAIRTAFVVALTVMLGNPALPGIAIGAGLGALVTTGLIRRWQDQNHETLVVARRRHSGVIPQRPSYYRVRGD